MSHTVTSWRTRSDRSQIADFHSAPFSFSCRKPSSRCTRAMRLGAPSRRRIMLRPLVVSSDFGFFAPDAARSIVHPARSRLHRRPRIRPACDASVHRARTRVDSIGRSHKIAVRTRCEHLFVQWNRRTQIVQQLICRNIALSFDDWIEVRSAPASRNAGFTGRRITVSSRV